MIFLNPEMSGSLSAAVLALACAVDSIMGDPRWLPHPVRLIGTLITYGEGILRKCAHDPFSERIAGIVLTSVIVSLTYGITYCLQNYCLAFFDETKGRLSISAVIGLCVLIFLSATTIALRELHNSAASVINHLESGDLIRARHDLGMIVGRDTQELSAVSCIKAAIESVAENLSDGVIAPIFWFTLGGLPLAMAYKAVNTLDSMIGYRNERYRNFGWAAARLDDLANYIPARLAGGLIVLGASLTASASWCNALHIMRRDGRNHLSPNSGVPEAAMAGALGIQLGGPSTYNGITVEKPFIGDADRPIAIATGRHALRIMQYAACAGMTVSVTILWGLS